MISQELIEKYKLGSNLEELKAIMGDTKETELMFYKSVLSATDHIPLKIFESFIKNMATAFVLEIPNVIIGFFKDIKVTYNEVLTARKTAREEINRIEAEVVGKQ